MAKHPFPCGNGINKGNDVQTKPTVLKRAALDLLHRYSAYCDSNAREAADVDKQDADARIVVVSRRFYSEFVRKYPITDLSELKRFLNSNQNSTEFFEFHRIGHVVNQQRQVTTWQFDRHLLSRYPKAMVWLPESAVIDSQVGEDTVYEVSSLGGVYFAARNGNQLYSACRSGMLVSTDVFCSSVGVVAANKKVLQLDKNTLASCMADDFIRLSSRFFRFSFDQQLVNHLKVGFGALAVATLLYGVVSTGYLYYLQKTLEASQQQNSPQLEAMLKTQTRIKKFDDVVHLQKDVITQKKYTFPIWLLFSDLIAQNVKLGNCELQNDTWLIRGETANAAAVLEYLTKHELVESAEFVSPVRRNSDLDSFVIGLKLRGTQVADNKQ